MVTSGNPSFLVSITRMRRKVQRYRPATRSHRPYFYGYRERHRHRYGLWLGKELRLTEHRVAALPGRGQYETHWFFVLLGRVWQIRRAGNFPATAGDPLEPVRSLFVMLEQYEPRWVSVLLPRDYMGWGEYETGQGTFRHVPFYL